MIRETAVPLEDGQERFDAPTVIYQFAHEPQASFPGVLGVDPTSPRSLDAILRDRFLRTRVCKSRYSRSMPQAHPEPTKRFLAFCHAKAENGLASGLVLRSPGLPGSRLKRWPQAMEESTLPDARIGRVPHAAARGCR